MNFLEAVANKYAQAHNGHYAYGDSHSLPPCGDGIISCDRLASSALWDIGYTNQPAGGVTVVNMEQYFSSWGFTKITNASQLQAGDIVLMAHNSYPSPHWTWHAFVLVSFNPSTMRCDKYDMGSQTRIDSAQPFRNVPLNEWEGSRHFHCGFRVSSKIPSNWKQLTGLDRYDTCIKITKQLFTNPKEIIVAAGDSFPGLASAVGLAGHRKCPILITAPSRLSGTIDKYLDNNSSITKATVIGGNITQRCKGDLYGVGVTNISTLAGADRCATSEAICDAILADGYNDTVFITLGTAVADIQSVAGWAYKMGAPILLSWENPSAETIKRANQFKNIYIIGGGLKQGGLPSRAIRLSGADRDATCKKVIQTFPQDGQNVCLVNGSNDHWVDGLLSAQFGSQIVLCQGNMTAFKEIKNKIKSAYLVGGVDKNKISSAL